MRIEFGKLSSYVLEVESADPKSLKKTLVDTIESELKFYRRNNELLFSEIDFDVVILYHELKKWLSHAPLKDFTFDGDSIGWLLDLHFTVESKQIIFAVEEDGVNLVRESFPREEFLNGIRDFCTALREAVKKEYGAEI